MRWSSVAAILALLIASVGAASWLLTKPSGLTAAILVNRQPDLSNGETMFNIGGCASCHTTTGQTDHKRLGGGLALKTKFGTFNVPNISQHPDTGIGRWTEIEFVNAMLKGVGRNGEHLYPSFPYASYQRMPLDDVRDLYAYMKSLPPDDKASAPHELAFPYNIRNGLGLWKLVNLDGKPFAPDPKRSAELNRGAYLIEGPGHCAECHSPRDMTGAIIPAKRFAGGLDAEGKDFVPNITQHEDGVGKWTEAEIFEMLGSGFTPGDKVAPPMSEVIENTARLSEADRKAMAAYMKSMPGIPGRAPAK